MGKYFITGNAGTGKSTIVLALREQGFTAYDIDEISDIRGFLDTKANKVLDELPEITEHGPSSFTRYTSFWKELGLKKLLDTDETIFLSGSSTLQERFYPLFDTVFGLVATVDVLEARLATRTNNPIGNNKKDRIWLLGINERVNSQLKANGAIIIDANKPLDSVVDQILSHVNEK